ncbi:hypothetical protein [Actinoplanes sp. NBRC 103695]|uniref:hypothetical protein n=1 Tax=Actinoplanes sp. NBRC 103695 TaxID=3032202 RepID=UPI002555C7CE|nr:hypothetical protein [Actinoplanes sp. NBRC 103695]
MSAPPVRVAALRHRVRHDVDLELPAGKLVPAGRAGTLAVVATHDQRVIDVAHRVIPIVSGSC